MRSAFRIVWMGLAALSVAATAPAWAQSGGSSSAGDKTTTVIIVARPRLPDGTPAVLTDQQRLSLVAPFGGVASKQCDPAKMGFVGSPSEQAIHDINHNPSDDGFCGGRTEFAGLDAGRRRRRGFWRPPPRGRPMRFTPWA